MNHEQNEVASIVTLRFPGNETPECDRGIPRTKADLPDLCWLETNDHVAGIFRRQGQTRDYDLEERCCRRVAQQRGANCF